MSGCRFGGGDVCFEHDWKGCGAATSAKLAKELDDARCAERISREDAKKAWDRTKEELSRADALGAHLDALEASKKQDQAEVVGHWVGRMTEWMERALRAESSHQALAMKRDADENGKRDNCRHVDGVYFKANNYYCNICKYGMGSAYFDVAEALKVAGDRIRELESFTEMYMASSVGHWQKLYEEAMEMYANQSRRGDALNVRVIAANKAAEALVSARDAAEEYFRYGQNQAHHTRLVAALAATREKP